MASNIRYPPPHLPTCGTFIGDGMRKFRMRGVADKAMESSYGAPWLQNGR